MKLHHAVTSSLAVILSAKMTRAQTIGDPKFSLVNTYDLDPIGNFGGGWMDNDFLYITNQATTSDAGLFKIPITRNSTTGVITGFGAIPDTPFFSAEYMDGQILNGPGGHFYYDVDIRDTNHPQQYCWGDVISGTYTNGNCFTDWASVTTTPPSSSLAYPFEGVWQMAYSPIVKDPDTGYGALLGSRPYGLWQLFLKNNGSGYYVPKNATKLCDLPSEFVAGGAVVPSGTYKNSIIFSNYDEEKVSIVVLDQATGLCIDSTTNTGTLGTASPKIIDVITDVSEPWAGVMLDPLTNDLFVGNYDVPGTLYHIKGYPPGLDVVRVVSSATAALSAALGLLAKSQRQLAKPKDAKPSKAPQAAKPTKAPKPAKAGKGKTQSSAKPTTMPSAPIPSAAELADSIVNSKNATAVTAVLDNIVTRPSFTENVLSGGDVTAFQANVDTVTNAITSAATALFSSVPLADQAQFQAKIAEALALLKLLRECVEK